MLRNNIADTILPALVKAAGVIAPKEKDIDAQLGQFLFDIQHAGIFKDSKTFVDLLPTRRLQVIGDEYNLTKDDPLFDMREFVDRHFRSNPPQIKSGAIDLDSLESPLERVGSIWRTLERSNRAAKGTLLPLPHTYIVPGGRFAEQFYWDSYFMMLGLASDGKWQLIEGMIKNFAYQIRRYGYIPTANRTYLLSRSQPPFFSHMIRLLATHKGEQVLREYLPYMKAEYDFWMRGQEKLDEAELRSFARVVRMPGGEVLNRYYDNKSTPRPESLMEDVKASVMSGRDQDVSIFLHTRAAAESGWDFSSRWFLDPHDIHTIHTADIIPVDLNALLYHLEMTIADGYRVSFNSIGYAEFTNKARARKNATSKYLWCGNDKFFKDYNFHQGEKTSVASLAAAYPLYTGMATQEQADYVAEVLRRDFLCEGGLVTTLVNSGQQWDSPNGWAPLQWISIHGLRRYGHDALADEISKRWLQLGTDVYLSTGRLVEKYNVVGLGDGLGGGGEYELQDGFGWTNGVYQALSASYSPYG